MEPKGAREPPLCEDGACLPKQVFDLRHVRLRPTTLPRPGGGWQRGADLVSDVRRVQRCRCGVRRRKDLVCSQPDPGVSLTQKKYVYQGPLLEGGYIKLYIMDIP